MKKILFNRYWTFATVLLSQLTLAQIPNGYYNNASGKSGDDLKDALNDIIDGHTELSYANCWDALKVTDRDPNNSSNVIGIYSRFSMDAAAEYDGGSGWNREHTWAQSRGDFGTSMGAGTDLHHLRAADISTNSARNNRVFDDGGTTYVDASGNYSGTTPAKSGSDWTWEPGDGQKGDVARMLFYMATRYEGENGEVDLELTEQILSNTDSQPLHGKLSTLLQWHEDDPVDQEEMDRHEAIYSYQNNRNPFIDHPEYADYIWGGGSPSDGSQTCSTTISSFPYAESFESGFGTWSQGSSDDFDWSVSSGSTPSNNTGPSSAQDGTYYAYVESSSPNYSNLSSILQGPCFDLSGQTSPIFSFQYHMYGASSMGDLSLEVSTNGTSWTQEWSQSGNQGNSWLEASVDLSSYAGSTIKLRYVGTTGTTWQGDMAIDNLSLSSGAAACNNPTNLAVSAVTSSSFSLSWSSVSGASNYTLEIGGNTYTSTTNSYTFSNASASTTYLARVRSNCSSGSSEYSSYVSVTTSSASSFSCSTMVSNFPYTEGFESGLIGWTQSDNDDFDWSVNSGSTPSSSTGPSSATEGSYYAYAESSSPNYSNLSTILDGPCFDFSGVSSATIDFQYHMYGASSMGDLELQASTNGSTWITLWSASGNQGNSWLSESVSLSAYDGTTVKLRFNGTTGTTWQGDMAIDDIVISIGGSTGGGSGSASDLFISEYIEGSSYNKAVEIANLTGSAIDLSAYSLKRQVNGAGSWGTAISLSGTLSDNEVYTLAHTNAESDLTNIADLTSTGTALLFNGNDPVGLFKNDVLIDIVGTFDGGSSDFAKNVTLARNTTQSNTTYTTSEWDTYAEDTFSYFGNLTGTVRAKDLITGTAEDLITATIYPNPAADFIHVHANVSANGVLFISFYDMQGQLIHQTSETAINYRLSSLIDVSTLGEGVYFIQIGNSQQATKLIIE